MRKALISVCSLALILMFVSISIPVQAEVPHVEQTSPYSGETNVALNAQIWIRFSTQMAASATKGAISLTKEDGSPVGITVTCSEQGHGGIGTIPGLATICTLSTTLASSTTYILSVSKDAISIDGTHLSDPLRIYFTTESSVLGSLSLSNTTWFIIIIVILVIALVVVYYRMDIRRSIRKRSR